MTASTSSWPRYPALGQRAREYLLAIIGDGDEDGGDGVVLVEMANVIGMGMGMGMGMASNLQNAVVGNPIASKKDLTIRVHYGLHCLRMCAKLDLPME